MRFTPTRPSRTRSELSREAMSLLHDVGPCDPVVESALLAVEADPQVAEEERRRTREIPRRTQRGPAGGRRIPIDIDDTHFQEPHAGCTAHRDLEDEDVDQG